jgi:hypothetical protein
MLYFKVCSLYLIDHVDGVRQYLWTAATNGPIVHPQVIYEYGESLCNDLDKSWLVL